MAALAPDEPPSNSGSPVRMEIVAALSIGVAALYQLALIVQPLRFLCEQVLFDDDAYYYFRIARQLATDGRASFDGIHSSNGVQFSWTAVLVLLARWVHGEVAYVRAALTICLSLNVAAGILIERLARRLHSRQAGLVAAVAWSGTMVAGGTTLTGMEYSLDVCLVAASLLLGWRLWLRPSELDRTTLALGIALPALMVWTRLDGVPLALPIWLLLLRAIQRSASGARRLRRVAALGAGALLAGLLYCATSYLLAGTWTPISGLAKQHLAGLHFAGHGTALALTAHLFWWLSIPLRAALAQIDPRVLAGPLPQDPRVLFASVALLGALLAGLWGASRPGVAPRERSIALGLLVALGLGLAHAGLMVAVIGHFAHVTARYFAWLAVIFAVATGVVVSRLGVPVARLRSALLLLFAFWLGAAVARVSHSDDRNLRLRALALAEWIDRNTPPAARIGAWNAGQLGYFSRRTVVNLDGLANDRDYLEFLRSGQPLRDYLDRERIDFLADYNGSDLSMPFRASWDRRALFRGTIPWSALEVVREDASAEPPLYLVKLRRGEP